ncbi:MAG: hypothetical protein IKH92_04310 [Clostridiales bacterium]|nr:hypothetical protein [Clostridiales bacterium]
MNSVLTKKGLNEQIKEALDFINEHKTLKALLIILLTVATCNAVYEVGARFGRFLYLIIH